MVIYIGADHRGTDLKNKVMETLRNMIYETADVHPNPDPEDDYPDIAAKVAAKLRLDPENSRGILICGSGAGMDIAANKFPGIRSVLGVSSDAVYDSRNDDDVNILALAADYTAPEAAVQLVQVFLNTPYAAEPRFARRLQKLRQIETGELK